MTRKALLLSLALHVALGLLLWLPALAPQLLPRAPITMVILPRKEAPPALPAAAPPKPPPPTPAPPKPGPASPGRPARRRAPARPTPPSAAQAEAAAKADLEGLGALYGDTPMVAVLVRTDLLRSSPHRPAAERLLAAFPDTRLLAAASALKEPAALTRWVLDETAGLLILTTNPAALTATNLIVLAPAAGETTIAPRTRRDLAATLVRAAGVSGTGLQGDPRRLQVLAREVAVYARPETLQVWEQGAGREGEAFAQRLRAPLRSGAALTLVVHRAEELLRLQDLPTPTRVTLELSADEAPRLKLRLRYADEAQAERMLLALPQRLEALSASLFWLGLRRLVADLRAEREGSEVRLVGALPGPDVDALLDYLALLMPTPPGLPPRTTADALDGGAPRPPPPTPAQDPALPPADLAATPPPDAAAPTPP